MLAHFNNKTPVCSNIKLELEIKIEKEKNAKITNSHFSFQFIYKKTFLFTKCIQDIT